MSIDHDLYGRRAQVDANGNAAVSPHGPAGTLTSIMLDPDDGDAADADTERWTSTTGCVAFRVIPKGAAGAVAALDAIIVGWSTTAADVTAVNTLMAALDTGIAAPGSGGTEVVNCTAMFPINQAEGDQGFNPTDSGWIHWDNTTRIKTIAVRASGADYPEGVLLQVVT